MGVSHTPPNDVKFGILRLRDPACCFLESTSAHSGLTYIIEMELDRFWLGGVWNDRNESESIGRSCLSKLRVHSKKFLSRYEQQNWSFFLNKEVLIKWKEIGFYDPNEETQTLL